MNLSLYLWPKCISSLRPLSRRAGGESRSGFTLIELLVVISLLAILIGILLPMAAKMRKTSQILAMKTTFTTIAQALDNYKADFRDYPRCGFAMTDSYSAISSTAFASNSYLDAPPRIDPSLAMGLLGAGAANAVEAVVGGSGYTGTLINGDSDGADGPGFRTVMSPYGTGMLSGSVAAGAMTLSVLGMPTFTTFNNGTLTSNGPAVFTVVSLGGPGSPDAHIPITAASSSSITLAVPVQGAYAANTAVGLLSPTGRTWGPYLKPDDFKVAYVASNVAAAGSAPSYVALPVLEDEWGGPILYLPQYNTYTNQVFSRSATSTGSMPQVGTPLVTPPTPGVTPPAAIGPLLGLPGPSFTYNTPMVSSNNYTAPSVFWDGPLGYFGNALSGNATAPDTSRLASADFAFAGAPNTPTAFTTGQIAAMLMRMGDLNANNAIENGTAAPEHFAVQLPYILMSPGPDGIFEDLGNYPQSAWNTIVSKSDDVYNFEQ